MKKIFGIKNIIIFVLSASTAIVAINPKGMMPNRTKYHKIVDSIPYPVHDTIPFESLVVFMKVTKDSEVGNAFV